MFTVDVAKGKRTETKIVSWTTGIASMPEAGGVLDQPYRLLSIFQYFIAGDHAATFKELS